MIAALFMFASPAVLAEPSCTERAAALRHLAKKYQEAPVAVGLAYGGGLVEVLATGDGSTWTIIVTTPQGMSCLVAAGEGWRNIPFVMLDPRV